jgi:hypothetical protein
LPSDSTPAIAGAPFPAEGHGLDVFFAVATMFPLTCAVVLP